MGIEAVAGAAIMETFIPGVPLWETASEWVYGLSVPAERLLAASLLAGQVMGGHERLEAVLACRPGWLRVEVPRVLGSAFALGLPSFHAVPGHRVLGLITTKSPLLYACAGHAISFGLEGVASATRRCWRPL